MGGDENATPMSTFISHTPESETTVTNVNQPAPLKDFLSYCQACQPYSFENIQRFFEGVICFPYDQELLLQAYLFLNINQIFSQCDRLLLFEKPPYGEYTNMGKCDFVYLTHDSRLLLIETKYIDTNASGDTERKRRNKHRNKVIKQVQSLTATFCENWGFTPEQIEGAVFTTDPTIAERSQRANIWSEFITTTALMEWQQAFSC